MLIILSIARACGLRPERPTYRDASWWRDADNHLRDLRGRKPYQQSVLVRLCSVSDRPRQWSSVACQELDSVHLEGVPHESRLLLEETDSSKDTKASWVNLLEFDCEREASKKQGCVGRHDGGYHWLPNFGELSHVPPSEISLLRVVATRPQTIYQEQPWSPYGYPAPLTTLRVSLSPNGVRMVSLNMHRPPSPAVPLLGLPEPALQSIDRKLTTEPIIEGQPESPSDYDWGDTLLSLAMAHFVPLPEGAHTPAPAADPDAGSSLDAALAAIEVPLLDARGKHIPRSQRRPSAELASLVTWLKRQLDLLAPAEARALRRQLGHARASPRGGGAPAGDDMDADADDASACSGAAACGEAGASPTDPKFAPGGARDGCGPHAPFPQPHRGPCVIRYVTFAPGAAEAGATRALASFTKYYLTKAGPIDMERARRKLDMAQSEYKAGWNPPYLHTRTAGNYRLQGKHGLAIGYTLLVRCGPTLKHWQSCVNVAARETFPEVRRFIQTKPIFRLADKHYLGVGESTKLDLTSACAEAAAVVSIGKRPYFEWRMAFAEVAAAQCPPWNIMRAAQDALVANLDKACVDSKGPLGVVAGVICDPSWITHFLLQQKHLVDGVDLKLKEVAGERYGLVFERVPFEVMLALHNPLVVKRIEEAPWPEKEALLVVSEAIYGDGRLVDDPSAVVPRLGWLRGPNRWGSAEVEHRTAILSLTSETDRQALQAAIETRKLAGKLHQVIKNNDVFKNEDGLVLFSIVTSTT